MRYLQGWKVMDSGGAVTQNLQLFLGAYGGRTESRTHRNLEQERDEEGMKVQGSWYPPHPKSYCEVIRRMGLFERHSGTHLVCPPIGAQLPLGRQGIDVLAYRERRHH